MLLLVIAAFTLVFALSETATAPYDKNAEADSSIQNPVDPVDPGEPATNPEDVIPLETPEPEPPDEPKPANPEEIFFNPTEEGYIPFLLDPSEIHRGYLLLVNPDHSYTIPDDPDIVNIREAQTTTFRIQNERDMLAHSIIPPLDDMMSAFINASGVRNVAVISAFRTLDSQQRILNSYISRMGRREALRWAALPGHSEHHTGLALDFGVMTGNTRNTFTGTGSTAWFRRNSHNYGFILRYQQSKTHITQTAYEPWHYRYVGVPHATIMYQKDFCLEEYIDFIREYSFEEPFEFEHNGIEYLIYFTTDVEIKLPLNSEYEISGNNIDGFIITAVLLPHDPSNVTDVSI